MRSLSRAVLLTAPLVLAAAAHAQIEPPPEVVFTPSTSPLIGYFIAAVLFGIIVSVSLLPSKRTHTDL